MLEQGFGLQTLDGSILTWARTRETIEATLKENELLAFGTEIIPLEVNTAEITEKGLAIREEIHRLWNEKGMIQLHFDKQPGWFKMSPDERAQMVLDMLMFDPEKDGRPLNFEDGIEE